MITVPMLWMWKLRFRDVPEVPSIVEPVTDRNTHPSAPLKFCFSLCYSLPPSNNMKNEIGVGKDANSKKLNRTVVRNFFSTCTPSCELMRLLLPQCL